MQNLMDTVVNEHSGKKYSVSTVRKFPLKVWETAIIRGGFLSGFSSKNFVYVEEVIGEFPELILTNHANACMMAKEQPEDQWRMTFEEVRARQSEAARLA